MLKRTIPVFVIYALQNNLFCAGKNHHLGCNSSEATKFSHYEEENIYCATLFLFFLY